MALAEDLPIYKTASALSKVVFAGVRGLPRDVRIILGNKLMDECTQMTTLILRANSTEQRERHLLEIRERQKQAEALNQLIFDTTTSYGVAMLTPIPVRAYAVPVTVNPVIGFGDPDYLADKAAERSIVRGFFVGSVRPCVMAGLDGETFGSAGFQIAGSPTSFSPATRRLATLGGGHQPHIWSSIMNAPARNPSTLPASVAFGDTTLTLIDQSGVPHLTGRELARALGYADASAIQRLYSRNAAEFTADMTLTVKMTVRGQVAPTDTRIFSPRGCHLIAMFARTERAAAFRRWVLDVLEGIGQTAPAIHAAMDLANTAATKMHETVLRMAMAGEMKSVASRWLVSLDYRGEPQVSPIPNAAAIMTLPQMLKALNEPNGMPVDTETLAAVANACVKRLAVRCDRYKLKSEGKPVPPAWEGTA